MKLPVALRKKVLAVAGAGAFTIAMALLGGTNGLEGRRYIPYEDVTGVLTVCDGHTGTDIVKGRKYSDSECDHLLAQDVRRVRKSVDQLVQVPLNDYQKAALYSFVFNTGTQAFSKSTLLKKLNAGDVNGACDEMRRWVFAGGRRWQGLKSRREMERLLCLAEDSHAF